MLGTKKKQSGGDSSSSTASASSKMDLVDKAGKCMNRLIEIASQLHRNIILDQVCLEKKKFFNQVFFFKFFLFLLQ